MEIFRFPPPPPPSSFLCQDDFLHRSFLRFLREEGGDGGRDARLSGNGVRYGPWGTHDRSVGWHSPGIADAGLGATVQLTLNANEANKRSTETPPEFRGFGPLDPNSNGFFPDQERTWGSSVDCFVLAAAGTSETKDSSVQVFACIADGNLRRGEFVWKWCVVNLFWLLVLM